MSKLLEKLKRLYELSKIRPEEENDEARLNEARTASFLLLKTARENGVQVKFIVKGQQDAEPTPQPPPRGVWGDGHDGFQDLMDILFRQARDAERQKREQRQQEPRRPSPDFEDFAQRVKQRATAEGFKPPQRGAKSKVIEADGALLIESKFAGRCKKCHRTYQAGERVWWVQGIGCAHEACGHDVLIGDTG